MACARCCTCSASSRTSGGGLVLLDPTEPVRGILTLTGLDRQLPAADTLERAQALLATGGQDARENGAGGEHAGGSARGT